MTLPAGEAFLTWLDREIGPRALRVLGVRCRRASPEEVWGTVLCAAWRSGVDGSWFETRAHAENWAFSLVRRSWVWMERQGSRADRTWAERVVLMEPRDLHRLARTDAVEERSVSADALRMRAAFEALSPKGRRALQLLVVDEMRPRDAAALVGVKSSLLCQNRTHGLDELRRRFEGTFVARADAVRAATARRLAAARQAV